jgi:uncharacterized protein YbaR (Trm112 family)
MSTTLNPAISEELLNLLVCPKDHSELRLEAEWLVCTACETRYPIVDGIPNMLIDID